MLITSHPVFMLIMPRICFCFFIYEQSNDVQGSSNFDSKDVLTSGHGTL